MSDEPKVKIIKLSELAPDARNANKGTERGAYMLDRSLSEVGAGRSIVADKNNKVPAGNKTLQAAVDAGFEEAVLVESDGKRLVVVQRTDWDLEDEDPNNAARRYAFFDNRTSEVSLDWSAEQLLADLEAGVDLSEMFHDDELAKIVEQAVGVSAPEDFPEYDEDLETEYCCPKCGYEWAGSPK